MPSKRHKQNNVQAACSMYGVADVSLALPRTHAGTVSKAVFLSEYAVSVQTITQPGEDMLTPTYWSYWGLFYSHICLYAIVSKL